MVRQARVAGRPVVLGASLVWALGVITGGAVMLRHGVTAGASASAPARWPEDAPFARQAGRPLLVAVAHPHCPCTVASLNEINRIRCDARGPFDVAALMVQPRGKSEEWVRGGGAFAAAERIPGARVVIDEGGAFARRLGAETSGQTLLFDGDGRLVFAGGVTSGRGHEGDSAGRSAVLALIERPGEGTAGTTPVFGCPLFGGEACVADACCAEDTR